MLMHLFYFAECRQQEFLGMAAGLDSMMARGTRLHGDHGGHGVDSDHDEQQMFGHLQTSSLRCVPGRKCLAAMKWNSKTTVLRSCKGM
jgi:hypothetical protein